MKSKRKYAQDNIINRVLTFILYPIRLFIFYFIIQFIFRIIFRYFHNLKFNKNGKKLPKTPFLVLGNHVTDWDGFYINTYLKRFVYFLVHDEVFKYKLYKVIAYNLFGQIKRGKSKNDIGPLKKLVDLRNEGKCIGIFPEGDLSYTGRSLEINKSISKLSKILNMPIVLTRLDGASYQRPRWSFKNRKTPIEFTIVDVINLEDVNNLSNEELYNRIKKGIYYNDNEYQKIHMNIMKAKKPAENLENVLFLCPDCNNINCMKSENEFFYCTKCGYKVKYNTYNQFELINGKKLFLNIADWDDYQKSKFLDIAKEYKQKGKQILSFDCFTYNKVYSGSYFYKHSDIGTLSLDNEKLKFKSKNNDFEEEYNINDITDLYIQFKGAVEFTIGEYRYRFISKNNQHYGYRYECFINILKEGKLWKNTI